MASSAPKSPIRLAPLRVPGQSIEQEIDDVAYDGALAPMMLALLMTIVAGLEWWRYIFDRKPNPLLFTSVAIALIAWATWRFFRTRTRIRQLKLGRDGERAVAQYLEWFRTSGFFVFHDVPTGDANIDHVLIGTRGIYTIETKTHSKPVRGECKVQVREDRVSVNGHHMDRNPVVQAKAQARWLHNFFKDAQFKVFVQPVVVFPGWFIEPFDTRAVGAWVLEPKALDGYIGNESERISRDEVKAMASALSSYIRAQAAL